MEREPNQSTEDESEVFEKRKFRNKDRETEIEFATMSLPVAVKLGEGSFNIVLNKEFGEDATLSYPSFNSIHDFLVDSNSEEKVIRIFTKPEDFTSVQYLTLKKVGERILITPTPLIHDIFLGTKGKIPFEDVLGILEEGFKNPKRNSDGNATVKDNIGRGEFGHRSNIERMNATFAKEGITKGDLYSIELYSDEGQAHNASYGGNWLYVLESAKPERILSVNIRFTSDIPKEETVEKIKFYREQITEKYGIPVRCYETQGKIVESDLLGEIIHNSKATKRIFPEKKPEEFDSPEKETTFDKSFVENYFRGIFTNISHDINKLDPEQQIKATEAVASEIVDRTIYCLERYIQTGDKEYFDYVNSSFNYDAKSVKLISPELEDALMQVYNERFSLNDSLIKGDDKKGVFKENLDRLLDLKNRLNLNFQSFISFGELIGASREEFLVKYISLQLSRLGGFDGFSFTETLPEELEVLEYWKKSKSPELIVLIEKWEESKSNLPEFIVNSRLLLQWVETNERSYKIKTIEYHNVKKCLEILDSTST